jgi:hypothetical protein
MRLLTLGIDAEGRSCLVGDRENHATHAGPDGARVLSISIGLAWAS